MFGQRTKLEIKAYLPAGRIFAGGWAFSERSDFVMRNLKTENVFKFFEEISHIPRGSGNTVAISEYCENFALERGLWVHRDSVGNVIMKKPATSGYETAPAVILQGHLDMVCIADEGVKFDFEKQPLMLETDGEWIWARGTTLGGDDGIAVAIMLAILDSTEIEHPLLEAVFTVDEETGMEGARVLDTSILDGKRIINIDSENEGVITAGCAGGVRVTGTLHISTEETDKSVYEIRLSGLLGGHSGVEIDKGRANAVKVMGRLLSMLEDVQIVHFCAGVRDNAIPSFACVQVAAEYDIAERVGEFEKKLDIGEEKPIFSVKEIRAAAAADKASTSRMLDIINTAPNGVQCMSRDIDGLVETSLNLGIAETKNDEFKCIFLLRSSDNSSLEALKNKIAGIITDNGGDVSLSGEYGAWEYKKDSPLRTLAVSAFTRRKITPKIEVIHAGLECGIFAGKIADMDCISIGPDIMDIHTPKERMNIASVERVYGVILEMLAMMKNS